MFDFFHQKAMGKGTFIVFFALSLTTLVEALPKTKEKSLPTKQQGALAHYKHAHQHHRLHKGHLSDVDYATLQRLPNVGYLFRGYNILYGNPVVDAIDGHDPGIKQPIFKTTYIRQNTSPDQRYACPDSTSFQQTRTCNVAFSSESLKTEKAYLDSMSVGVSASGGFWGFTFKANVNYQQKTQELRGGESVFVRTESRCSVYTGTLDVYTPPKLHNSFIAAVNELVQYRDSEVIDTKFKEFVETFGTHFISGVTMGAKFGLENRLTTESYDRLESEGLNIDVSAGYSGAFSVSVGVETSIETENRESFETAVEDRTVYTYGSQIPADASGETWASTASNNPVPIRVAVSEITELFTTRYMETQLPDVDYTALGGQLLTFLEDYCNLLLLEGSVRDCIAPVTTANCRAPLGMGSGTIADDKITASSSRSAFYSPQYGRLNYVSSEHSDGWSAGTNNVYQWLQVDFTSFTMVSKVATQGKADRHEWVKSYAISYSYDGVWWENYLQEIFVGNTDRSTIVTNNLQPAIVTKKIRIKPQAWKARISMRVEFYGCHTGFAEPDLGCTNALGLELGQIRDSAMTASFEMSEYPPSYGRLNNDRGPWLVPAHNFVEWLQVDIGSTKVITRVATQGFHTTEILNTWANGWVLSYALAYYSRDDQGRLTFLLHNNGQELAGNTDATSVVVRSITPRITTRYIRILPRNSIPYTSLRAEFYGCAMSALPAEETVETKRRIQ